MSDLDKYNITVSQEPKLVHIGIEIKPPITDGIESSIDWCAVANSLAYNPSRLSKYNDNFIFCKSIPIDDSVHRVARFVIDGFKELYQRVEIARQNYNECCQNTKMLPLKHGNIITYSYFNQTHVELVISNKTSREDLILETMSADGVRHIHYIKNWKRNEVSNTSINDKLVLVLLKWEYEFTSIQDYMEYSTKGWLA